MIVEVRLRVLLVLSRVGLGASFEDVRVEGDSVDDGGDEAAVWAGGAPFNRQVGWDGDRCSFF
jgi:hypothetical protein